MSWLPKKLVVVPHDFSDLADQALDEALQMVADPTHVHVVHVLPPLEPTEPGVIWKTVDDAGRIRHATNALGERLADSRYQGVQLHVMIGSAGDEIAQYASRAGAELIVVSSHGRSVLSRVLIGSVADRIVRLAPCPVLVLRRPRRG